MKHVILWLDCLDWIGYEFQRTIFYLNVSTTWHKNKDIQSKNNSARKPQTAQRQNNHNTCLLQSMLCARLPRVLLLCALKSGVSNRTPVGTGRLSFPSHGAILKKPESGKFHQNSQFMKRMDRDRIKTVRWGGIRLRLSA